MIIGEAVCVVFLEYPSDAKFHNITYLDIIVLLKFVYQYVQPVHV